MASIWLFPLASALVALGATAALARSLTRIGEGLRVEQKALSAALVGVSALRQAAQRPRPR